MNLSEINWDFNAVGTWPFPVKAGIIFIVCAAVASGGVYYDTMSQLAELESAEKKEGELKLSFEAKQRKAVNLQDYQDQLTQIEAQLFEMIRQMPTEEEVASLLTDISQTGLASGLEFRLFKPSPAISKDFYSELPINIQVIGKYESLGLFVSGLATLPRIVTVHDVSIVNKDKDGKLDKEGKQGLMIMNATLKTYNESKNAAPDASSVKKKRGAK